MNLARRSFKRRGAPSLFAIHRVIIRATSRPSVAANSFWKLGGLTHRQLSRAVFEEINANNVFGRAAELAFYCLFALFPLIFLMMTLFGLFASHNGELQTDLLSYLADFLPPTALQLLRRVATEIAAHASHGKLTFGVVSALWFMSNTISSTISFLNAAYHVRESRSWFKARAIALVLSLLISILLLATLFVVLLGSHLGDWLGAGLRLDPLVVLVGKAIRWPTAIFFLALSCSLIYRYGPDLKERRRWQWFTPGAAFGAFIWLVASFGFRMYLHYFDNYSVSYGSLGALMILLVWLYATALACLIGAEINAEIERSSRHDEGPLQVTK